MKSKQNINLTSASGERIRRQYINFVYAVFIYIVWMVVAIAVSIGGFGELLVVLRELFPMVLMLIPLLIVSGFNRFRFGRILAVLTDEGILVTDRCIPWEKITRMEYVPTSVSRRHFSPCAVVIHHSGESELYLERAPLHLLFRARRRAKHIKIGLIKSGLAMLVLLLVLPILFTWVKKFVPD